MTELGMLRRENRQLRAELAGEDGWEEEKLAADLAGLKQLIVASSPS